MKKLIMVLALCALGLGTLSAQGGGNGGSGSGSGSGSGHGGNGHGGNGPNAQQQQAPVISNRMALQILRDAHPFFNAQLGISLGQLIQQYRNGNCTIEWVATTPPSLTFRVRFGGLLVVIVIDEA